MIRTPYRVIWITGMSRAGSMWLFNVVRALVRRAGLTPVPDSPSVEEESSRALALAQVEGGAPGSLACLKSHEVLPADFPGSRFLVPYRDVRAAAVSFMHFMRADFEAALGAAAGMMAATDHYAGFDPGLARLVSYAEIEAEPAKVVGEVAAFLALPAEAAAAREIAESLSRERVLGIIAETNRGLQGKLDSGRPIGRGEAVPNFDGTYRARDPLTGFQSNHVSGRQDWREGLSPEQIARLDALAKDWLDRYGLPL